MYKTLRSCAVVALLFMITAALLKSIMLSPVEGLSKGELTLLDKQWEKTADIADGDPYCEYVCALPEDARGRQMLSIEVFWNDIELLLNGEPFGFYADSKHRLGSVRQWIDLPDGSAGGTLAIRSDSKDRDLQQVIKGKIYIGAPGDVFIKFFYENLPALIFGCLAFMLSLLVAIYSILLKKRMKAEPGIDSRYLGLFILLAGIWVVTDSNVLQLFTGRTAVVVLISFLSFFAMPICFIGYIQSLLTRKSRLLAVLNRIFCFDILLYLLLYFFPFMPGYIVLIAQHLLICIAITAVIVNCVIDIRRNGNKEIGLILLGMGLIAFCAAAAIVLFWTNPSSGYSYWYIIGILAFTICLVCLSYKKMHQHLERSINARLYEELAYKDLMTGMYNRTAFMTDQGDKTIKKDRAFIMFDINRLKQTNDRYGHQTGDNLIIEAARCIMDTFEEIGKCYRIGGDEFVVVIDGLTVSGVERRLEMLEERLKQINKDRDIAVGLSYGYAVQDNNMLNNDELLKKADANMYIKKKNINY
ncbi:MAG: diguanylate cyclase domain-containing protein [Candidatus Ornithomonoglobus sp.]